MQVGPLPLVWDLSNYATIPGDEYQRVQSEWVSAPQLLSEVEVNIFP